VPTIIRAEGVIVHAAVPHGRNSHEAEWAPFQTHYYSENLATPGIEPGLKTEAVRYLSLLLENMFSAQLM
jgi:hypothetical protein